VSLPPDLDLLGGLEALAGGMAGAGAAPEEWPLEPAPPEWEADSAPLIPLSKGLTLVTAIEQPRGDYESIKRVTATDERAIRISYSTRGLAASGVEDVTAERTVLRADLRNARTYRMVFGQNDAPLFPGSTALGISRAVLEDLRTAGEAELSLVAPTDLPTDLLGDLTSALAVGGMFPLEGSLTRAVEGTAGVPVLLNGKRVWLPGVHARGTLEGLVEPVPVQFWFLDDPDNPITLRALVGGTRLQLVRIDLPARDAARCLEQALAEEDGPVELFGLYFAFDSAEILPESEPVLEEVAGLMRRNPAWRLRVEGHTDNLGTPEANLDLSRRRALAVARALVERLGGGMERLSAAGYGESRPVESNETLQGRARNRRVELIRY
jgi:outer membrane protein OmpA-like peptidoglycan-associated protein